MTDNIQHYHQDYFNLHIYNDNYIARNWRCSINQPIIFYYNGIHFMMTTDFCIYSINNENINDIQHYYGTLNINDRYNDPLIGSIVYNPITREESNNLDWITDSPLPNDVLYYFKNRIITSLIWE